MGNAQTRAGLYEDAIENYENALNRARGSTNPEAFRNMINYAIRTAQDANTAEAKRALKRMHGRPALEETDATYTTSAPLRGYEVVETKEKEERFGVNWIPDRSLFEKAK